MVYTDVQNRRARFGIGQQITSFSCADRPSSAWMVLALIHPIATLVAAIKALLFGST
jgi:hypothetical protein